MSGLLVLGLVFSWYIKDFDVKAMIEKNNMINVSELITVDFKKENRHGIYRKIPSVFRGHPVGLHINKVYNVTQDSHAHKIYKGYKFFNIRIGDPDRYVSGINRYVVDYSMKYTVFDTGNVQRLVYNAVGTGWGTTIEKASFKLIIPDGVKAKDVECFTGGAGATRQNCVCENNGEFINCHTTNTLYPYEGFTIKMDFPEGTFKTPGFFTNFLWKFRIFWPILIPLLTFILMYRKWKKYGKDPETGTITTTYEPPKDLLPIEAGTLIDEFVNSQDLSAEILNLALKGYIKIQETPDKKDYIIVKLNDCDKDLSNVQCDILKGIFFNVEEIVVMSIQGENASDKKTEKIKSHLKNYYESRSKAVGTKELKKKLKKKAEKNPKILKFLDELEEIEKEHEVVALSSLKNLFYIVYNNIKEKVYEELTEKGYFAGNPDKIRNKYSIIGVLFIFTSFVFIPIAGFMNNPTLIFIGLLSMVLSGIIIMLIGNFLPRKTVKGVNALRNLKGLLEFIRKVERDRLKKFALDNPEMFKNLLPYAIAFGEEKKWAEVFSEVYEVLREKTGLNTVYVSGSMGFTSMVSSMGSTLVSSPSSGSGSGSSSSGGGAGGGGGGAW